MKEPKVQVGILFEPQIEFVLLNPYRMDGNGSQRQAGSDLRRRQDSLEWTPV